MRSITINQTTMLTNFKEMWIPCTADEYPEVKQLLEGMGYKIVGDDYSVAPDVFNGINASSSGKAYALTKNLQPCPTVTLDELRAMAKPNDDLRLLKERVGIMERSIMGIESKINEIHKLLFEE